MAARQRSTRGLSTLILGLAALFLVAPLIAFLFNAFARGWFYPQLLPQQWTLDGWTRAFSPQSDVLSALGTSLLIAGVVTPTALIIGLPAGRALGLYRFPGKRLVEFLLLLPALVPPLAVSLGLAVNFLRWGWAGNWLGVSVAHLVPVLPYTILIFAGLFRGYSLEHEQQARALGAKPWAVVWHVTLPLIRPGIVVAGLFAFLISWSQYLLTLLIGSGRVITLPILLFSSAAGGNNTAIAVQALLFTAPALLLLIVTNRLLTSGAAAGLGRL